MKKHEILSPQSRTALFDPPTDPVAIVRHYTFSPEDLALIRERRRTANRLGFAVQLAYFRHPGRIMRVEEQEVAGAKLELYVITFEKDKMTLRVPTLKAMAVGMRKLSSPDVVNNGALRLATTIDDDAP